MSKLMKMKRLVDGDDHFAWRVEAACWVAGVEYKPEVLRFVAGHETILELADLRETDTIDSTPVTDEAIQEAIQEYKTSQTPP